MAYAQTVAVDMDGTLAAWEAGDGTDFGAAAGAWLPGSREFIEALLGAGVKVVVHTCRATWEPGGGTPAVEEFLRLGEFVPVRVVGLEMEAGPHADDLDNDARQVGVWVGVGKPIASAYVDDRGVPIDPVRNGYDTTFRWVLALCGLREADALESVVRP